jgi:hypothetical protein
MDARDKLFNLWENTGDNDGYPGCVGVQPVRLIELWIRGDPIKKEGVKHHILGGVVGRELGKYRVECAGIVFAQVGSCAHPTE